MRSTLAVTALMTLAAACHNAASEKSPKGAEGAAAGPQAMPPMPVEAAVARADTVVDAILATGQIEALHSIELRPEIEGRIVEIYVREGSSVAEGTPLLKIDDAELKAEVARAEAERDLAKQ